MPTIALENIRSAYNVWNIIRSADALGFDVILLGYSPSPFENGKVVKTSLGAEKNVNIKQFYNVKKWLDFIKNNFQTVIAAELTENAIKIQDLKKYIKWDFCIIMWNEVDWVSLETLEQVDLVSYIPMKWIKESMNVCEAASIFMYELEMLCNPKQTNN